MPQLQTRANDYLVHPRQRMHLRSIRCADRSVAMPLANDVSKFLWLGFESIRGCPPHEVHVLAT
jgi:hypothetical protein